MYILERNEMGVSLMYSIKEKALFVNSGIKYVVLTKDGEIFMYFSTVWHLGVFVTNY